MTDILARICADKRAHIAARKAVISADEVRERALDAPPCRGFASRLAARVAKGATGLIAEVKKASPSKGLIRQDFSPAALALAYEAGGATCLSVLTDTPYFQGEDDHLVEARAASSLPVLRKDFMLDPYQVFEARAIGADCILIIMAALNDAEARTLSEVATALGMDVLIEVHDADELTRASRIESRLLGINNRNLKTLRVDLAVSEELATMAPHDRLLVAESGLNSRADLDRMAAVGAHCVLVGESLMRQADVAAAVRNLLGEADPAAARTTAGSL